MPLLALLALPLASCGDARTQIPYSELKQHIRDGAVASVVIGERGIVATPTDAGRAALAEGDTWEAVLPGTDADLIPLLEQQGVVYDGDAGSRGSGPMKGVMILVGVLGLGGLLMLVHRRQGLSAAFGGMDLRDASKREQDVRYRDVAGIDEVKEELEEVVAFLKDPERFTRLGARPPKGVLLVGAPGTGKTLLARATAGEAGVPFFPVSASGFVEMYVGVGAKRVRKLFDRARDQAPCIVFIDELDAVGKGRGHPGAGSNDEREQTLNQLLVEMDGFDPGEGIVVMAATNRPETLDSALMRPGRFDRRITVNVPDRTGRRAILDVHARRIRMSPSVDLDRVAGETAGFAGADLANLLNEAALLAARQDSHDVGLDHIDAAIDRVLAGPKRHGRLLSEKERHIVAVHEAGHAIVAERCAAAEPVGKISIVPRTIGALGFTRHQPEDRLLLQRDELQDRLRVLLGGRAAEEIVFGQVSTGASNDLERATGLARRMVTEFGMSPELGPVRYTSALDEAGPGDWTPSASTIARVDREVHAILEEEAQAALAILQADRAALDAITETLLEREVMDRDELLEHLRRHGRCTPLEA